MKPAEVVERCLVLAVLSWSGLAYAEQSNVAKNGHDSPSLLYIKGSQKQDVSKKDENYEGILEESKRLFRSSSLIREIIEISQLQEWYSTGVVEINFDPPCRVELLHPQEHSYSVSQLIIPLEGWRKPGKPPATVILARQEDTLNMYLNSQEGLKKLNDLAEHALGHELSDGNSVDVEARVSELVEKKDYAGAIKTYRTAIESPKDQAAKSRYFYNLSMIYRALRDDKQEIEALRNAAEITPDKSVRYDYLEALGKVMVDSKRLYEAKKAFQEVLEKSSKEWQRKSAKVNLLRIESAEGKLPSKIEAIQEQLKNKPDDVPSLEDLALIYDQVLNQYDKAIPVYQKLVGLRPADTFTLSRLQFSYEQTGQLEEALSIFERLLAKDTQAQSKVLDHALKLAIQAKQPQTAMRWGKKYAEAEPNDPNAWAMLGRIAFQIEDYGLAAQSLAKAESLTVSSEQRDQFIIEQIAAAEKQGDKSAIEKLIRRLIKTTQSDENRATGFLMLVRFLQQEKRLQELVTW